MAKRKERKQPKHKNDSKKEQTGYTMTDILGSYTGRPADGGKPVQDADDL